MATLLLSEKRKREYLKPNTPFAPVRLTEIRDNYSSPSKQLSDKVSDFYKSLGIVASPMKVVHEQHMPYREHSRQGLGTDKEEQVLNAIRRIITLGVTAEGEGTLIEGEVNIYLKCEMLELVGSYCQ